jgi:hypothetical protein
MGWKQKKRRKRRREVIGKKPSFSVGMLTNLRLVCAQEEVASHLM